MRHHYGIDLIIRHLLAVSARLQTPLVGLRDLVRFHPVAQSSQKEHYAFSIFMALGGMGVFALGIVRAAVELAIFPGAEDQGSAAAGASA